MMTPLWRQMRDLEYKPEDILRYLGIGAAPVPVRTIAEKLGAEVLYVRDPKWSGALDTMGVTPKIYVNAGDATSRRRFSIAHEIGHLILHDLGVVFRDTTYRSSRKYGEEGEANDFAARLLMPRHLVEREMAYVGDDIDALARTFQVSPQAMRIRLQTLRHPYAN